MICPRNVREAFQQMNKKANKNCSQARIPEKLAPGSFDIWGSSHQIFHVLVVMAAGAHLIGLLKAFDYAHSSRSLAG